MKKAAAHVKSSSLKDIRKMLSATADSRNVPARTPDTAGAVPRRGMEPKAAAGSVRAVGSVRAAARKVRIRLMDSSETGTIIRTAKSGAVEVELDGGLTVTLREGEFVVTDEKEDRLMLAGGISRKDLKAKISRDKSGTAEENAYDLHIEAIPGGRAVAESSRLDFQMAYFHTVMRKNLPHRGKRFTIIHGVGDGILRNRIRKELDEVYALGCTYIPGPPGVTIVTVK